MFKIKKKLEDVRGGERSRGQTAFPQQGRGQFCASIGKNFIEDILFFFKRKNLIRNCHKATNSKNTHGVGNKNLFVGKNLKHLCHR